MSQALTIELLSQPNILWDFFYSDKAKRLIVYCLWSFLHFESCLVEFIKYFMLSLVWKNKYMRGGLFAVHFRGIELWIGNETVYSIMLSLQMYSILFSAHVISNEILVLLALSFQILKDLLSSSDRKLGYWAYIASCCQWVNFPLIFFFFFYLGWHCWTNIKFLTRWA